MPYTASAFESWPVSARTMRPHYEAVLSQIPFAAEDDDLAGSFPLMGRPAPLPQLSPRSRRVLDAYSRNRAALNARGITMGKARLAFKAADCVRCRLCMTGCPYGLIYSAAQTFDALRRSEPVTLSQRAFGPEDRRGGRSRGCRRQGFATGQTRRFEADRIFVACGAMGTTRLVANSLNSSTSICRFSNRSSSFCRCCPCVRLPILDASLILP